MSIKIIGTSLIKSKTAPRGRRVFETEEGKIITADELADMCNIKKDIIHYRIQRGENPCDKSFLRPQDGRPLKYKKMKVIRLVTILLVALQI